MTHSDIVICPLCYGAGVVASVELPETFVYCVQCGGLGWLRELPEGIVVVTPKEPT